MKVMRSLDPMAVVWNEQKSKNVLSAAKLQSVDSEIGELPLDGALEFQIDMLSMLINYVRYFRTEKYDSPSLTGKKY